MTRVALGASALAVALCAAVPAAAQNAATPGARAYTGKEEELLRDEQVPSLLRKGLDEGVTNGPNDRALKSASAPDFQLVATQDEKVVTMAVTSQISGRARDGRFSYSQFSLKASTPLEDDGAPTRIFGLKGFAGGTEVTLGYTHFFGSLGTGALDAWAEPEQAQLNIAIAKCREVNSSDPKVDETCDPETFPQGDSRFLELYNRKGLRQQLDVIFPSAIKFIGVDATGNQKDFDYLDPTTRTGTSTSKFSYKGSVFGGFIFPTRVAAVTGTFTYIREYKAGDTYTVCNPGNPSDCATGLAAPHAKTRAVGSIEGRFAFGFADGKTAQFALAPEISYDVTEKAFSIDVPLYFAKDKDGKLRGGARLNYLNEKNPAGGRRDGVTLSLFIGVPFTLFN